MPVDDGRQRLLTLGAVDGGIGGGVDDSCGVGLRDDPNTGRGGVGQVRLTAVQTGHAPPNRASSRATCPPVLPKISTVMLPSYALVPRRSPTPPWRS